MRFTNPLQKTGIAVIILSAILFIISSSIKEKGSNEYIWIEAENADYVIAPLYIESNEEASGGKVVVFKEAHHNYSGIAKYTVSVKKEGTYCFWGRCLWKDACANRFTIRHDNRNYNLGEDHIFGRWHWVKGPSLHFRQGINEVFLVSDEAYSQIDEILLTMDMEYVPFDKLREIYYLDFEDSLINKLKIKNENNWCIINDSILSTHLSVHPRNNQETALLDNTDCKDDFIFQVIAKPEELNSKLLIILNYINDYDYRFIKIGRKNIQYGYCNNNNDNLIFEKKGLFLNNDFNSIALEKTNEYLKLKIEGKTVLDISLDIEMKGKVGMGASEGNLLLDNIAYYYPVSFIEEDNFHDNVNHLFHKNSPEKAIKPFEKIKEGHRNWWKLNGNWKRISQYDDTEYIEYIRGITEAHEGVEKPAILIWGNDFWKNYTFEAAAKVKDDSGFGICTYFQDSLNYYLFKWIHDKDGHYKRQLIKMEAGNEKILASDNENFVINTWYNIGVKMMNDKILAFVNNKSVLTASDHSFTEGRLGFWTNSPKSAYFDDIKISKSDNISNIKNTWNYTFYTGNNGQIAKSLGDWEPNSQKHIYLEEMSWDQSSASCYVSKEIFKDVILNNINTFPANFKAVISTSPIPSDIDAFFEFTSQGDIVAVYKFILSNDKINLWKNGELVASSDIRKQDREKIEIYRQKNKWIIEFTGQEIFEYKDKINSGPCNMTIGYSGIGKGKIFLNRIFIEEQP